MKNSLNKNLITETDEYKPLAGIEISDSELQRLSRLVYKYFGINLTSRKKNLVVSRLQKYMKQNNFSSFTEFLRYVESDGTGAAVNELINRISTNYTYFFRERRQFDFIYTRALPEIVKKAEKRDGKEIRIWSAGCSTGDEAYSLLITLLEYLGGIYAGFDSGIRATDICETALAEAKRAVYPISRLKRLNRNLLNKYFVENGKDDYAVKKEIRKEVTFRRFNLMNHRFPFKNRFEIIMCRNVMIYFDTVTTKRLVNQLADQTVSGGYLFLGSSEALGREFGQYRFIQPGIYIKEEEDES